MKPDELEQIAKLVEGKIAERDEKRAKENADLLKAIEELKNQIKPGAEPLKAATTRIDDAILEEIKKQLNNNQDQINRFPDKKSGEAETTEEKLELVKGQIEGWEHIQRVVQQALEEGKVSAQTKEKLTRLRLQTTLTELINRQDAIDGRSLNDHKAYALERINEANEQLK